MKYKRKLQKLIMAICIGKGFYQSFYEDKNEKCPLKKTE